MIDRIRADWRLSRNARSKRSRSRPARAAVRSSAVHPRERLHEFWRHPDAAERSGAVSGAGRAKPVPDGRWCDRTSSPDARILEIGCNVGRTSPLLLDGGLPRSHRDRHQRRRDRAATRRTFPELGRPPRSSSRRRGRHHGATRRRVRPCLHDGRARAHPSRQRVDLREMVRITRSILVTVEDERGVSGASHATRLSEDRVRVRSGSDESPSGVASEADGLSSDFVARVFAVTGRHGEQGTVDRTSFRRRDAPAREAMTAANRVAGLPAAAAAHRRPD